jgi:hypothetical protein
VSIDLLVDHDGEKTHHSGAAVVQLLRSNLGLLLLRVVLGKIVNAEVSGSGALNLVYEEKSI